MENKADYNKEDLDSYKQPKRQGIHTSTYTMINCVRIILPSFSLHREASNINVLAIKMLTNNL